MIKVLFKSRHHFIQWVLQNLPHPTYCGMEIDRINNDGHYEPGNIRLVTRKQQNQNKHNNLWLEFKGEMIPIWEFASPYERSWTQRLIWKGMTGEQIIENAKARIQPGNRCKAWRRLTRWLVSRGYMT